MTDCHRTFAFTIRPRDGVTDDHIDRMINWIKPRSKYYKVVTEKEGTARHIHAFMVSHKPLLTHNVRRSVLTVYKDLSETEREVLRNGVKTAFTIDWLKYLEKGDFTEVHASELPEVSHLQAFFPPKTDNTKKDSSKRETYYTKLEQLWLKHQSPDVDPSPVNVRHFLFRMMYSMRVIDVLRDDRSVIQVSRHLSRFLQHSETCHFEPCTAFEPDL